MISGEDWPKPFVWNFVYVLARLFARSFLTFDLIFWLLSMPDLSLVIQSRPFVSNCEKFTMNIQLDKDLDLVQLQMNRNLEWKLLLDRQSLVCESARIYEILWAAEQETHHHNNWLNQPRPKKISLNLSSDAAINYAHEFVRVFWHWCYHSAALWHNLSKFILGLEML